MSFDRLPMKMKGAARTFIQGFDALVRRTSLHFLLAGILLPSAAIATEVVPWSLAETARQSDDMILGTVTSRQSRWGDASRRWIETDFTFQIEEVIHSGSEAFGDSVVLTFWGGTLEGETQAIADLRHPAVNERLVLMLRPGWQQGGFTPIAGFNHGLFAVAPDQPGGPALVRDYAGQSLALTTTGQVVRGKDIGSQPLAAQAVDLPAFTNWVRTNSATIKSQPSELAPHVDANDPRVIQTFSATPEVSTTQQTPAGSVQSAPTPAVPPQNSSGRSTAAPTPSRIGRSSRGEVSVTEAPQRFSSQHQARLPIVVNQFTASFAPWSPEDQYLMSRWNYYATEVFRVRTTPTGTFGWPNGSFDLAGWPPSADLLQVYGSSWTSLGAGTIGVTFLRYDGGGWIIESDIALNPAFSFTLDDEWIYDGSSAQGFRQVMLHELGHMHGLQHNFNDLSTMNYLPARYRAFGLPYMDDAAGIRAEYPGAAVSRTDLGVYLYRPTGFQSAAVATMPSSVAAGATFTVNDYQIENVGTTTIETPTIEWYLTAARNYLGAYYYLGTSTYFPPLPPFTRYTPSTVDRTLAVPAEVEPGEYYLAAFVRDDGGAEQFSFPFSNNYAFSRSKIAISSAAPDRPPNDDWANAIGVASPTSVTGYNTGATTEEAEQEVDPAGSTVWWYVQPSASGTLTINTFGSNFDTMLHIYTNYQNGFGNFTPVASSDDAGGTLQSEVTFAVNAFQFYEIRVAGFSSSEGDITLNVGPVITGAPAIRIAPLELSIPVGALPPTPIEQATVRPGPPHGISASPHDILEFQPDGTQIELNIRGGPSFHWLEDKAGFTVVQDRGNFVYARLDGRGRLAPTALLVGKANPALEGLVPRTLPSRQVVEQLRQERLQGAPAAPEPTAVSPLGNIKNVVILMRFANHAGRTLPSVGDFDKIFNAVGGDPSLAPTGSVRDYYLENSYGMMVLNSTVYSWVTLPQTEQYYSDGTSGLNPRIHQAITSALNLADPLVDFSQYDGDEDGYVDSIAFVHSGYGAEWGGSDADGTDYNNRIWSHRWFIPTWTSAEGVSVSGYHINPGLWSTSGSAPGRIGVITHETGHFFGLPDLYDIDDGGQGIGAFGLMGYSWGFTSTQLNPPHFSAWSKVFLGWVTPTLLTASGDYAANRSATHPEVYKITAGFPKDEYLLIENRQPYGFESTLPEGGLAIWHIDETKPDNSAEGFPGQSGWPGNNRHYKVALLQADGEFELERGHNVGDAGDLYRGTGVSEISDATLPNTKTYQNGIVQNTGNRIHAISASAATMNFTYEFNGTTGSGFEITNDGTTNLNVSSITGETSAPWISWTPVAPFNVAPGATQFVQVSVDSAQAPEGLSTTRLLVASNDPAKNPYPGGVFINVTKLPVVSILASDATAGEPGTGLGDGVFTFSRTGLTAEELTVSFTVAGSASSGLDFLPIGTSVVFPSGAAMVNKILVVIQDDQEEGDETVDVKLASGSGYLVGSPDSASVTISDALLEEIIFADGFE